MNGPTDTQVHDMTYISALEDNLAAQLHQAASKISHTECLDDEQRSEVYTILGALRSDTANHRALLSELAQKLTRT